MLPILIELAGGGRRYQDLHDSLAGVSYKVLTETLRRAERDGFIVRHLDGERIETATLYGLTYGPAALLKRFGVEWVLARGDDDEGAEGARGWRTDDRRNLEAEE